jgi:signal transduction histidine kinase
MAQAILERRDAAECRRLAELLHLDAVGVVRGGERRRVSWWASPELADVPLGRILDGDATDWILCPKGDDLVFAHLTDGAEVRSAAALGGMLAVLTGSDEADGDAPLDGVAPEDPIARERTRLAYAIHDGLTQVVTASILELEWQARRADVTPVESVEALSTAAGELRKALDEIRNVLAALSGTEPASAPPIEDLVQSVLERWQLPATWSVDGDLNLVPAPVLDVASSVIRESVANAAKHAAGDGVAVAVRATRDAVEIIVQDHGKGFEPTNTGLRAGHLGLEMMRRRVATVHGTLDVESAPGQGTRVVARLPVTEQGVTP